MGPPLALPGTVSELMMVGGKVVYTNQSQLPKRTEARFRQGTDATRRCQSALIKKKAGSLEPAFNDNRYDGSSRSYTWAAPPSTNNSVPVMKLLSSEARNTRALPISSGVPRRPRGTVVAR